MDNQNPFTNIQNGVLPVGITALAIHDDADNVIVVAGGRLYTVDNLDEDHVTKRWTDVGVMPCIEL